MSLEMRDIDRKQELLEKVSEQRRKLAEVYGQLRGNLKMMQVNARSCVSLSWFALQMAGEGLDALADRMSEERLTQIRGKLREQELRLNGWLGGGEGLPAEEEITACIDAADVQVRQAGKVLREVEKQLQEELDALRAQLPPEPAAEEKAKEEEVPVVEESATEEPSGEPAAEPQGQSDPSPARRGRERRGGRSRRKAQRAEVPAKSAAEEPLPVAEEPAEEPPEEREQKKQGTEEATPSGRERAASILAGLRSSSFWQKLGGVITGSGELLLEDLRFQAISTRRVSAGENTLHLAVYEQDCWDEVRQALFEKESLTEKLPEDLHRQGVQIAVELSLVSVQAAGRNARTLNVELGERRLSQEWRGEWLDFAFPITLPHGLTGALLYLRAKVFFDDVPASRLQFTVAAGLTEMALWELHREDVQSVYFSYARQDEERAQEIADSLTRVRPDLKVVMSGSQDRRGNRKKKVDAGAIDGCDLFYLCWSLAAAGDARVHAEITYAAAHKDPESFTVIALQGLSRCALPEEISDRQVYGYEQESES